jgi:fumarylacetoacetate (FAA) hydrolase family protein
MDVALTVTGEDGFVLEGSSSMRRISRDPAALVAATINDNHAYPDGVVLMLGTMFAPIEDRDAKGEGFTHHEGDVVTIATPKLGALVNRVARCNRCAPWRFGTAALMRNLAGRGLLS